MVYDEISQELGVRSTETTIAGESRQTESLDAHIAENSAATTMNFVLEAMRISNAFLLNLPSEGSDVALDGVAAVCQMDVASLKKYHALLHTQNSTPESDRFEPLPPLIIPQASGSHEPQTPSTAVTTPSPLTPPPSLSSPFKDTSPSTSNVKREATQETIVIVDPPSPNDIANHSSDRIPSPPSADLDDYSSLEFGDLEYPSSEADSEDFEAEETPMTSVPKPTTFSQLLERMEDKESILDRILTLMDYGKDMTDPVKMDLS
ncbi:hypothetical protein SCHPADRAFT_503325 [Schizopora paradoxa]|uniref:Uncharacterized protein n=1 Tax=Schizopora paradoxa TaxID=27342 RepID=A0A0H2RG29_9AGAM|nr:hypothetical protein SCHPADRAFT_503325 [Schizopora paradoxa]